MIKLIEVKSELGAGTRGASLGVDAIKIAALDFGSSYFKRHPSVEVPNENQLLLEPVTNYYAKRIKGILTVCERLSTVLDQTINKEKFFPIVLSGDHSTSIGTIAGLRKAFPKKRLGVIWIDAHADIHSPYTTPSGNVHGMTIAASIGEDNLEKKRNNPDKETIEYWEKLQRINGIFPKITYEDLIFIAVRDMEPEEVHVIKKNKVTLFSVSDIRKKGVERIAFDSLKILDHCDIIYVSFDVDSMDPSISKGTGTPVPNGITEREAGTLVYNLLRSDKIACFEIVEVNPTLDKENLMAENAFEILLKATNQLKNDF